MDSRRRALHVCGQSEEKLKSVRIHSPNVTVILKSDGYWSARGFLMHYRVIGCTDLRTPKNGYLVHRSDSRATYMCCIDYVFPDSLDNIRELVCENEFKWNQTLPDCFEIDEIERKKNLTSGSLSEFRVGDSKCLNDTQSQEMSSLVFGMYSHYIIVPSVIIGTLLVLNTFIVIYLLHQRRKLREMNEDEEFLHEPGRQREPSTSVTSAAASYS
ncbi:hypothetical protein GQR58_006561 [Nymphon striatum]|nr:hypothetical protein GQR58_006561 [Nymphon striatum]